jgi:cytosine/adenosine deaminase-related metal-dependent hydrolase
MAPGDGEIPQGSGALLVTGARVLDPEGELHRPPEMDVLVEGGRIAALGDEARGRGQFARQFDASGYLITPGFINAHSHSHDTLLRGLFEQIPLESWGLVAFPFNWPPRSSEEIAVRTRAHAVECLLGGMTTVQDMVTIVGFERDHAEAVAESYSLVGIEAVVAPQFSDRPGSAGIPFAEDCFSAAELERLGRQSDFEATAARLETIFAHVSAPGVSWALGPVQPQICSDEVLKWTAACSKESGMRMYMHLYETRAEAVLARRSLPLDGGSAVRRLARVGIATEKLTVAHGVWIFEQEIGMLAEKGVGLATNPVTNLKLMNGFAPIRSYRNNGVTASLGCDNSSAGDVQNIFQAMKAFALIWGMQSPSGDQAAATEAFCAATVGGAKLLGMEGQIGRVAPGYRANLTFIDATGAPWRPLNSAVRQLVYGETGHGVAHVMVGGSFVVWNGRTVRVDERSLYGEIVKTRDRMEDDLAAVRRNAGDFARGYSEVAARVEREPLDLNAKSLGPL